DFAFPGRELYVQYSSLPISSCTLLCMALHSRAMHCSVLTVNHTNTALSKTAHS
ncbi:unnamed protein product, partial [Staurois parvus]